jgi:hypothetical protein
MPDDAAYTEHEEAEADVRASAPVLFVYLDDPRRLGSHMERGSWRTGGASMAYDLDAAQGRRIGSRMQLRGTVLGLRLGLTQIVTEHQPPRRKAWQTVGTPRLLVIGAYRMGLEITPASAGSRLWVFIDYRRAPSRLLAAVLGRWYARWCVLRMVRDAKLHFDATPSAVTAD